MTKEQTKSPKLGMLWYARTIWKWLSPRAKIITVAAIIAIPITLFMGHFSSAEVGQAISKKLSVSPYWFLDWAGNTILVSLLIGLLLFLLLRLLKKKIDSPEATVKTDQPAYRLLDDVALHGDQKDELGFEKFVARLARTVVLPANANSLVVGLEAPWGSGKSSALELLNRKLKQDPDRPIVIKFNPWLASGSDGLSRAFFSQFSGSLRAAGERDLAESFLAYGELLEELMPPAARILPKIPHLRRIAGRIPETDIEGERERISEIVEAVGRPVVVVIDDIDRLKPDDVISIFHLVKAVASFSRVAYVLAFDPRPVDAALERDGMYDDGREFRDKIIQANVALPRVPYRERKSFFEKRLRQRIASWKFRLLAAEERLLAEAIPLVLAALRTPRDIKRVLNKMLVSADGVRGEVNIADVLVVETIHSMFPRVIDLIRLKPEVVDAGDHEGEFQRSMLATLMERDQERKGEKVDRFKTFSDLYPDRAGELSPLLTFLFPRFFDSSATPSPAGDLRIGGRATLLKLLYQEVSAELSASAAQAFLEKPEDRRAILAEQVESKSLSAWLAHVRDFVSGTSIPEPSKLLAAIGDAVNDQFRRSNVDSSEDASLLCTSVIDAQTTDIDRWKVLEKFVSDRSFIGVTETIVVRLLRDAGLWNNGTYLGIDDLNPNARKSFPWLEPIRLDELGRLWVECVESHTVEEILDQHPNAGGILFRWMQIARGELKVKAALERALLNRDLAARFINLFPRGQSLSGIKLLLTEVAIQHLRAALDHPEISDDQRRRVGIFLTSGSEDWD